MTERQRAVLFWVFLLLFISITLVSLLVALQVRPFDNATTVFKNLAVGTVIAGIVGAILAVYRGAFSPSPEVVALNPEVVIIIGFEDVSAQDVDLEPIGRCEVWDQKQQQISPPQDILVKTGEGGWVCILPRTINLDDSIRLTLKDKSGQNWEVKFFSPLMNKQPATKR